MKIYEIIKNVATVLGLTDVVDVTSSDKNARMANMNYRVLLRSADLVMANLATNFDEFKASVTLDIPSNRQIPLCELKLPVTRIVRIVEHMVNGTNPEMQFKLYLNHLEIFPRQMTSKVSIEFVSSFVKLDDGEEINPFPISPQAIEYGILSEYAFISGMFNEAQVWRAKYIELVNASKRKSITMPMSFY